MASQGAEPIAPARHGLHRHGALRNVACLSFLLLAAGQAQAQEGPSFNCRFASTATEQAICSSPRLSLIERWVVASYESLAERVGRREARAIADAQLALRQACEGEPTCIEERLIFTTRVFEVSGAEPLPFPFDDASAPEPPLAAEALSPEERLARGPPQEVEDTEGVPASQPQSALASETMSGSALSEVFADLPAYRRINVQGRLAEAGYYEPEPHGGWDVATAAALATLAREASRHRDGPSFDPSTPVGAAALLDFVESDAFKLAFLGG